MFLVRYAHLDRMFVKEGDLVRCAVAWGGRVSPATQIGVMGNTGESFGAHLHIDVVRVPLNFNLRYQRYTMADIQNNNPPPSVAELNHFVDDTLFESPIRITAGFNDPEYIKRFNRPHPAIDVVPTQASKTTIFWNRSFAGRVIHAGFDRWYGNTVVIMYTTLPRGVQPEEPPVELPEPQPEVPFTNSTVERVLPNGITIYEMERKSPVVSTYGQTETFQRKIRYIKMHPDNFGFSTGAGLVQQTGYAGMNGTFYSIENGTRRLFPLNLILMGSKVIRYGAIHRDDGFPETVLCRYTDGSFGMERVMNAQMLFQNNSMNHRSRVLWGIGGISYLGPFGYTPAQEGYDPNHVARNLGSFRRTAHTTMGIDAEGFIYLIRSWESTRPEATEHAKSLGCIYAIGLDGGGSTSYNVPNPHQRRLSTREVANHLLALDLEV